MSLDLRGTQCNPGLWLQALVVKVVGYLDRKAMVHAAHAACIYQVLSQSENAHEILQ